MAKKKASSGPDKNAWLGTYGDMITLILVFFVLLYSISTIDQSKYRLLVKAFTADKDTLEQLAMEEALESGEYLNPELNEASAEEAQDVQDIENLNDLYEYLAAYVSENDLEDEIKVAKGNDMVYIRFTSKLFFQPNKAVMLAGGKAILDDIGPAIHMVEDTVKVIRIDGHTAETPPGDNTVNDRDLSTDRANTVLKYLEELYISDRAKLMAVGYGRYRPIASNDTEDNMAQNRRVEILVSKIDMIQDELSTIYDQIDEQETGGTDLDAALAEGTEAGGAAEAAE